MFGKVLLVEVPGTRGFVFAVTEALESWVLDFVWVFRLGYLVLYGMSRYGS